MACSPPAKICFIDSTQFVKLANNKSFADSIGLKQDSFEGYLLAADYEIFARSSPAEVIRIFYDAFKEFYNDSLRARTKEIGFTIHEIITLASIIKGETDKEEEMPTISGVYHNRLRIGMKLQADPTIQYVIPGGWKRLTYKDLELDSPYNTYKYFGLPPGPINSPGKSAILAALYPEKNDYLYFVADGSQAQLACRPLFGRKHPHQSSRSPPSTRSGHQRRNQSSTVLGWHSCQSRLASS